MGLILIAATLSWVIMVENTWTLAPTTHTADKKPNPPRNERMPRRETRRTRAQRSQEQGGGSIRHLSEHREQRMEGAHAPLRPIRVTKAELT